MQSCGRMSFEVVDGGQPEVKLLRNVLKPPKVANATIKANDARGALVVVYDSKERYII